MKVDAVMLSCIVYKKIFQHVLPVCWGERFFADSAMNQVAPMFRLRAHANQLVARFTSRAHKIDIISHATRETVQRAWTRYDDPKV